MGGDPLADALADREGAFAARIGQHDGEFVAPEARHHVGLARAHLDDGGRLHQRPAAAQVAVAVVDAT